MDKLSQAVRYAPKAIATLRTRRRYVADLGSAAGVRLYTCKQTMPDRSDEEHEQGRLLELTRLRPLRQITVAATLTRTNGGVLRNSTHLVPCSQWLSLPRCLRDQAHPLVSAIVLHHCRPLRHAAAKPDFSDTPVDSQGCSGAKSSVQCSAVNLVTTLDASLREPAAPCLLSSSRSSARPFFSPAVKIFCAPSRIATGTFSSGVSGGSSSFMCSCLCGSALLFTAFASCCCGCCCVCRLRRFRLVEPSSWLESSPLTWVCFLRCLCREISLSGSSLSPAPSLPAPSVACL